MGIVRAASRLVEWFPDRPAGRRAATPYRERLALRPMAEGLEGRTLLSIGLDPTFGFGGVSLLNLPGGSSAPSVNQFSGFSSVALQNGQVVGVGTWANFTSNAEEMLVTRLNTNGTTDTSFGTNGITFIPITSGGVTYNVSAVDIAVQSNDQILVPGTASPIDTSGPDYSDFVVARLNANGSLDTSFGTSGFTLIDFSSATSPPSVFATATSLAIAPDGQIVVAGDATSGLDGNPTDLVSVTNLDGFAVARLNANGSLDTSFDGTGMAIISFNVKGDPTNDDASGVAVLPDGTTVVVGTEDVGATTQTLLGFSQTYTLSNIAVAELNVDGTLDTAFNNTGELTFSYNLDSTPQDSADAVALQGSQIVIAGTSSTSLSLNNAGIGDEDLTVTRLNPDGTFDTTFNGTGKFALAINQGGVAFSASATSLATLPNGSLLVDGEASQESEPYNVATGTFLVALTNSGALDTTYGSNNGMALLPFTDATGRLVVQSDGKAVFATNQGIPGHGIARTTAPVPAVIADAVVTSGVGNHARVTAITIQFNMALNPPLSDNSKLYHVRVGSRGRHFLKIKKVVFDATTSTLTIRLRQHVKAGKVLQVRLTGSGIIQAYGQFLDNGSVLLVTVPTTT